MPSNPITIPPSPASTQSTSLYISNDGGNDEDEQQQNNVKSLIPFSIWLDNEYKKVFETKL